jgi:SacI restriction endonuclease
MPAEMNPLAISKGAARANFTRALGIAQGSDAVPDEWTQRATRIGDARNRTYTPVLGTILLAKATNPNINAFALKTGGVTRGYSPRSLAKDVFVPLCVESGIDIRTQGAEPFNNQPFFARSEIRREMVPAGSVDRADYDFLVDSVERADRMSCEHALLALAAYLRVRLTVSRGVIRPASPTTSLTQGDLEYAAAVFLSSGSDSGRARAFVAACLDLAFPGRVFDSNALPATRSLGDVVVSVLSKMEDRADVNLVAAVKARPVSTAEIIQLAERMTEKGADRGLLLALSPRQSRVELADGVAKAVERYEVAMEAYSSPDTLIKAAVLWSPHPRRECLARFPSLVSERLSGFRCDKLAHEQWRSALHDATGPRAEQTSLPLFGN